jgi:hypothetical protein
MYAVVQRKRSRVQPTQVNIVVTRKQVETIFFKKKKKVYISTQLVEL